LLGLLALCYLLSGCANAGWSELMPWLSGPADNRTAEQASNDRTKRSDPQVQAAQTMLAKLGYDPGAADGIEGPKTREAVRHYQQDTGQFVDGQVSPQLLGRLERSLRGGRSGTLGYRLTARSPPTYRLGSTFVYSDRRVETVVGLDGDKVRWRSNHGTIFTAHRNFVLPWSTWFSAGKSGQSEVVAAPDVLWPLAPGKRGSFIATTAVRYSERPDNLRETVERWDCRVERAERVSVVAGRFDALKVVCRRLVADSSPKLTRVWYYAPRIGHYVRMNDFYDVEELDRHVELVAIQPGGEGWPPAARAGLGWALRHALESMSSEEQIEWSSSAVETRVTIKPSARFERGDGKICRNYLQVWSGPDGGRSYPGTACREPSGGWHVPGLSDDPDDARGLIGGLN
jgi:hypothetical protein